MELFDEKFVHCVWDDELKGKVVFYADEIDDLIEEVNGETNDSDSGRKILYDKSCSHRHPFQIDKDDKEDCYRFVYYDPLYEYKKAYLEGKTVQIKDHIHNNWQDIKYDNILWGKTAETGIYRIKPEENQKWWVMPKYNCFSSEAQQFGQSYIVEEQKDIYSRSRPPLKSDFESKEEAEKWLKKYLENERLYKNAIDDIDNLVCNLGHVVDKLRKHEDMTEKDWDGCFELFNSSRNEGALKLVTK